VERNRFNKRSQPIAEINVVPYIDVMLVLLVIFMVTAPLLTQGVEVQLPQAAAEVFPQTDKPPLLVSVDKNGLLYLDAEVAPLSPENLAIKLRAALRLDPQRSVIVRGDRSVVYDKVLQAMSLLKQAGVPKVGLMTQQEAISN
jgi:biopolymer transport protein TolR